MNNRLRKAFLALLFVLMIASCQTTPIDQVPSKVDTGTEYSPSETEAPDQTEEIAETATEMPVLEETEELSFMEQGRAMANGTIADLPLCQASMEVLSSIDISKVGIDGENSWRPHFNDTYDRLVISEQREGYTRITILDKTLGDQWEIVYASDFTELRSYQVELSPSGKYIALIYPTFVSLFDVDLQQIVGKMTPHSQTIRWSWDESTIAVPLPRGICDPSFEYAGEPPQIILFKLYSVPSLEYLGSVTVPDESVWFLRNLWWVPDENDPDRYLLQMLQRMLLYEDGAFTEVEGLDVDLFSIILVEWIDENYYLSSYYLSEHDYSGEREKYYLVELGLFNRSQQLDEYILFMDESIEGLDRYIDIEYNPQTGGVVADPLSLNTMLHFDIINQSLKNPCVAYLDQIMDDSGIEADEDFYLDMISENVGFSFDEVQIIFYQINWE
ncbi:hypothetical protein JR338_12620 (plasmid) [Chloroflexota bacterium]|nr:hypothetical protein JR338_12620 [Chloroflexota bacterium]